MKRAEVTFCQGFVINYFLAKIFLVLQAFQCRSKFYDKSIQSVTHYQMFIYHTIEKEVERTRILVEYGDDKSTSINSDIDALSSVAMT